MSVAAQVGPEGDRVLRAEGDLDIVTTPPLLAALPELVGDSGTVVLDLTAVTFLDSSGVRLVDALAREAARRGRTLEVVAPVGTPARRLLDLLELTDALVRDPGRPAG